MLELPAHSITHNRAADVTPDHEAGSRNGDQAVTRFGISFGKIEMDDQSRASRPPAHPHSGGELGALAQPGRGRKHGKSRFRATSGRKALTALPATGSEDGATGASAHAQPKAVGLCAPAVVRLERALAHSRAPRKGPVRPGIHKVCGPQVRRNSYGTGPPPTRSNLVPPSSRQLHRVQNDTVVPTDTGVSSPSSNCGERLEAQGGTLLASHGPDLIAANRRSSAMMQLHAGTRVTRALRTQVVDDSVDERPLDIHEYPH
jgi:hypothetical protein